MDGNGGAAVGVVRARGAVTDAVVRVDRTDRTDLVGDAGRPPMASREDEPAPFVEPAADARGAKGPALACACPVRAISGFGGPLIAGLAVLAGGGVGLAPFTRARAPTGTVVPVLAAVGLRAVGPASGELVFLATSLTARACMEREEAIEVVLAELLSLSRRRPFASVVGPGPPADVERAVGP